MYKDSDDLARSDQIDMDYWVGLGVLALIKADTSDFNETEIRVLPMPRKDWDGKVSKRKPILYDVGINKQKDCYTYYSDEWRSWR